MAEDIWAQLDAYNKKYPDTDGDSDSDGKPVPKKKKRRVPPGEKVKGRGLLQNAMEKRKERQKYINNSIKHFAQRK